MYKFTENIVAKGDISHDEQFPLLPQGFQTLPAAETSTQESYLSLSSLFCLHMPYSCNFILVKLN